MIKKLSIGALALLASEMPLAQTVNFDAEVVGSVPAGWICGVTGAGCPRWAVTVDAGAPSRRNVLTQSGSGTYPWCVKSGTAIADGFVEVKFKPISGREDQAGGVVWRWKDADHYYVARANALENNVSLYYTEGGRRKTLKYVDAPVSSGAWHTLRVEFKDTRIVVSLDGKQYIALDDPHLGGSGTVGVWTKADSVTSFVDFVYGTGR